MRRRTARVAVSSVAAAALMSMGALGAPALAKDGDWDDDEDKDRTSIEDFAEEVEADDVMGHLEEFQDFAEANGNTRASGTPGYDETVEYLVDELENSSYEVTVQPFDFAFFQENGSTFTQVAPTPTDYVDQVDYDLMDYSGAGEAEATVVPVDLSLADPAASTSGCEASDFVGPDGTSLVAGQIALIQRGTCAFGDKVVNAESAGAVGVVIFNQGNGTPEENPDRFELFAGTLGAPVGIPAVSVSFDLGVAFSQTEGLVLRITADTVSEVRSTSNVIAETKHGDHDTVVMAGAHLDSVPEGAGINDNGSGSAALLEIALELADEDVEHENAVRFAWWGAEESGLLGSTYYVNNLSQEELDKIALYLNFDMIASPNYQFGIYDGDNSGGTAPDGFIPPGSAEIEDVFQEYYDEQDEPFVDSEFSGRSDYGPFIAVGIPAGGLFTGAEGLKTEEEAELFGGLAGVAYDPCYHQACDNLEGEDRPEELEDVYEQLDDEYDLEGNVNEDALEVNTAVIASTILSLARDASAVIGAGTP